MKKNISKFAIAFVIALVTVVLTASSVFADVTPWRELRFGELRDGIGFSYRGPSDIEATIRRIEAHACMNGIRQWRINVLCRPQKTPEMQEAFLSVSHMLTEYSLAFGNDGIVRMARNANVNAGLPPLVRYIKDHDVGRAFLTSAIDGSCFAAFFFPETGLVKFYSFDNEPLGYQNVENWDGFEELVRTNIDITRPLVEGWLDEPVESDESVERFSRNASRLNVKTRVLTEYDAYGNATVTTLSEDEVLEFVGMNADELVAFLTMNHEQISPRFPAVEGNIWAPHLFVPGPRGGLIGWVTPQLPIRNLRLSTFALPFGMDTLDVFFTNQVGNDTSSVLDLLPFDFALHPINFPGQLYGARVSTFHRANHVFVRLSGE